VQVKTQSTEPLQSGGALMLGGDQDCYGSCTDSTQAFNGLMDEVLRFPPVNPTHVLSLPSQLRASQSAYYLLDQSMLDLTHGC